MSLKVRGACVSISKQRMQDARNKIRHFLASAEDLTRLQEALPLEGLGPDIPPEMSEYHWRVVLYACLLRKYFQGGDEKLRLDRVLNAVAVADDVLSRGDVSSIVRIEDHGSFATQPGTRSYGEGEILQLALYGRYLHGDFEKWDEVRRLSSLELIALQIALTAQLNRIASVEELINRRMAEGHLVLDG